MNTKTSAATHEDFMRRALELGQMGAGFTHPSPSVGCVIVKNGKIIGEGFTQNGGRPHAEYMALLMAGENAKGADFYVTLEPCAHKSARGPTCSKLVIDAKPNCVFIAIQDPDPRTAGNGIKALLANNIKVELGILHHIAAEQHKDFFEYVALNNLSINDDV
jgi:diaminohydroxyphosphoribosylaminopyrimidine deaminase / 5-amino-6-(5-phosphoribosylamino)uracil reductase